MKSLLILAAIAALSLNAEASRNRNREARQEARIGQGVKSGELTARETKRLERGQKKIDAFQKKAMADGKLSDKEKFRLEKMQDRQNKRIHRQKHDNQSHEARAENPAVPDNSAPVGASEQSQ